MTSLGREDLRDLGEKHGLLAAILLQQPESSVWLGTLSQTDYAHLLLVSQTLTLPILIPQLDAVQLSNQPVLVQSRLLNDGTLALLVFPFECRLRDLDQRADAFMSAIGASFTRTQTHNPLEGLRARQIQPTASGNNDLLALFSGMPEADPSNDATQPFRISKISIQTLEKSVDNWKRIF